MHMSMDMETLGRRQRFRVKLLTMYVYTHFHTHACSDVSTHVYEHVYLHAYAQTYTSVYAEVDTHGCTCLHSLPSRPNASNAIVGTQKCWR